MDALSRALQLVNVSGSLFSRADLDAPWGVHSRRMPSAIFHVVVRGAGFVTVDDEPTPVPFRAGDMIVLPHGDAHTMTDLPGRQALPMEELVAPPGPDGLPCLALHGEGPRTSLLCGTFLLSPDAEDHLLPQLPRLIHAQGGAPTAAWLDQTLRVMADEVESGRPGSATVVARLADILFVQVLRAWLQEPDADRRGWLAALADPHLAKALALVHDAPAEPWTAEILARAAGLSRTVFYERFTAQVGESPAAYLTRWRMVVARAWMRRTGASLGEVAERVGYRSQAAFHKAFKRVVGTNPGAWRREALA